MHNFRHGRLRLYCGPTRAGW